MRPPHQRLVKDTQYQQKLQISLQFTVFLIP